MLFPVLRQLFREFVFAEAFGDPGARMIDDEDVVELSGEAIDPVTFFLQRVRSVDPWWYLIDSRSDERRRVGPRSIDQTLDFLQALYEIASLVRSDEAEASAAAHERGKARMRELVDPILGLLQPPVQLAADGSIVQVTPSALDPLVDHPLPAELTADDIAQDVREAVTQFRGRSATTSDRLSACVRLAGVLELLRERGDTKRALLSKDEDRLFEIANQFALRHNNAKQRSDYDREIFCEWVFYSQLAAIRLTARLRARGGS